jgi:hypothetical protein
LPVLQASQINIHVRSAVFHYESHSYLEQASKGMYQGRIINDNATATATGLPAACGCVSNN